MQEVKQKNIPRFYIGKNVRRKHPTYGAHFIVMLFHFPIVAAAFFSISRMGSS